MTFLENIKMFLTYPQNIPMLCQIIAVEHSWPPNKTIHYHQLHTRQPLLTSNDYKSHLRSSLFDYELKRLHLFSGRANNCLLTLHQSAFQTDSVHSVYLPESLGIFCSSDSRLAEPSLPGGLSRPQNLPIMWEKEGS